MFALSLTLCYEMTKACDVFVQKGRSCNYATRVCDPDAAFNDHRKQKNMDIICDISKLCYDAEGLGLVTVDVSDDTNRTSMWSAVQKVCKV